MTVGPFRCTVGQAVIGVTSVLNAITALLPGMGRAIANADMAAKVPTPGSIRISTAENLWSFNSATLLADVQIRYKVWHDKKVQAGNVMHLAYTVAHDPYHEYHY